jgi:signal peptidase I
MEADGIREGDMLLVSMRAYLAATPRRGDIVTYTFAGRYSAHVYYIEGGEVVSKVVALPGDAVAVDRDRITVSELGGRTAEYRVSPLPAQGALEVTVPEGTCFCLPPAFSLMDRGGSPPTMSDYVRIVAMPAPGAIHGRAFMVWDPLGRRHWIHRSSAEEAG